MLEEDGIELTEMQVADVEASVGLIRIAMNEDEACHSERTMRLHFLCLEQGIDDGRDYFVWKTGADIRALAGLHHYHWGPEGNVWLSWFAVHPAFRRRGTGSILLARIEKLAVKKGYSKLLVETYDHSDFRNAVAFYRAKGFEQVGKIEQYMPDGSAMLVFMKQLQTNWFSRTASAEPH